ncbi:hypothetical protein POM88_013809 [Heracleum sosnowskyi]|uniref:MORF/ORRM1/DAG-like MORF domain-containing protein n=1 Tax=Heracleum sosnowskyi TaxID=360622 RepID=A0AAD8J1A4_9APIA|nr:hypothetical protein POM88_013809 [Heracleum sosnowskyi]
MNLYSSIKPPCLLPCSSIFNNTSIYLSSSLSTYKPPPFSSSSSCYVSHFLRPISAKTNDPVDVDFDDDFDVDFDVNVNVDIDRGCDLNHWLIVMDHPETNITRDELIANYIKTLATVVGSEKEARMQIYSVSTRYYYAFGALISETMSYEVAGLKNVRWVLPDSYSDVNTKDYGVMNRMVVVKQGVMQYAR